MTLFSPGCCQAGACLATLACMICYEGKRKRHGVTVTRTARPVRPKDALLQAPAVAHATSLPLRLDLAEHSLGGFEWGYGGSGPAQLALALLADALGDDARALALCQAFKWEVVAVLPESHWQLSDRDIAVAARRLAAATEAAWD